MNLLTIAWRNLWRNKRRTAITAASILFAVFFAILMRSIELGSYRHMIKSAIESYAGFLQVQHPDYQDDPSLENTIPCSDSLLKALETVDGIKAVVPRIETFALASTGEQTKGIIVLGIDPEREHKLSNPENRLVRYRITKENAEKLKSDKDIPTDSKSKIPDLLNNSYSNTGTIAMDFGLDEKVDKTLIDKIASDCQFPGSYLQPNDSGVLVSDRLSKYLKLSVGDTLVLLGQGYQGATAAGLYPVRGIIKLIHPELDNKLVYMPINMARQFANLDTRVTTIAINLTDNSDEGMKTMQEKLGTMLDGKQMVVKNWKEFDKVLMQQIESDDKSGRIFLGFLYLIIFFGIFGTILMMIHERYREFGVMVSIGMKKNKLAAIIIIEMAFMGLIGVVTGVILSSPFIYFFSKYPIRLTGDMAQTMVDMGFDPIMPFAWYDTYMIWQGLVVALMVIMSCIVPLRKVHGLKEIEALRS
jgi:ABC-type lipoprotein release transport system permease subunit